MNKKLLIPIVIFLQFLLFFYLYLIQASFGIPMLNLLGNIIGSEFIASITPFSYGNFDRGWFIFSALLYPLSFLILYGIANRINPSFQKSPAILFYWFFWINVIFLIFFATLARAYLGFILIIFYVGLIILFTKSLKKSHERLTSVAYAKLYLHYFIINFLFIPICLGIFALFYLG